MKNKLSHLLRIIKTASLLILVGLTTACVSSYSPPEYTPEEKQKHRERLESAVSHFSQPIQVKQVIGKKTDRILISRDNQTVVFEFYKGSDIQPFASLRANMNDCAGWTDRKGFDHTATLFCGLNVGGRSYGDNISIEEVSKNKIVEKKGLVRKQAITVEKGELYIKTFVTRRSGISLPQDNFLRAVFSKNK